MTNERKKYVDKCRYVAWIQPWNRKIPHEVEEIEQESAAASDFPWNNTCTILKHFET